MKKIINIFICLIIMVGSISLVGCGEKKIPVEKYKEVASKYVEILNSQSFTSDNMKEICSNRVMESLVSLQKREKISNDIKVKYTNLKFIDALEKQKSLVLDDNGEYTVLRYSMEKDIKGDKYPTIIKFYFNAKDTKIQYAIENYCQSNNRNDYEVIAKDIDKLNITTSEIGKAIVNDDKGKIEKIKSVGKEKLEEFKTKEVDMKENKQKDYKKVFMNSEVVGIEFINEVSLTSPLNGKQMILKQSDVNGTGFAFVEVLQKFSDNSKIGSYKDGEVQFENITYLVSKENNEWKYVDTISNRNYQAINKNKDVPYKFSKVKDNFNLEEKKQLQKKINNMSNKENTLEFELVKVNKLANGLINVDCIIKNNHDYALEIDSKTTITWVNTKMGYKSETKLTDSLGINGKSAIYANLDIVNTCVNSIDEIKEIKIGTDDFGFSYSYNTVTRIY